MRIGDLNKRVDIEIPSKVSDGMGGFVNTYNSHATIWAAIWPISANEQIQAGQREMIATHRIRIRYRNVFNPNWRIRYGNRYFSIVSDINPNEKNKRLEMLCKETTK